MKKLMIAAAFVCAGVAAFGGADATNAEKAKCPYAYKVKIALRTTGPGWVKSSCNCGTSDLYRKKASKRYVGWIYGSAPEVAKEGCGPCGDDLTACGCNDWQGAKLVIWDYDTKEDASALFSSCKVTQLNRFGFADTAPVEMVIEFDDVKCGGFGKAGRRSDGNTAVEYVSGFCCGRLPWDCGCEEAVPANVWTICGDAIESMTTACYGKWTLQRDGSFAAKLVEGEPPVPEGCEQPTPVDVELDL